MATGKQSSTKTGDHGTGKSWRRLGVGLTAVAFVALALMTLDIWTDEPPRPTLPSMAGLVAAMIVLTIAVHYLRKLLHWILAR